jgi:DNA-binding NarL/FixJ family response regulator
MVAEPAGAYRVRRERWRVRVLIADGDPAVRERVRRVLGRSVGIVGEAGGGEAAVRLALDYQPDVVLMDIDLPGDGGIDATHRIKQERPETKVILLTVHDEEAYLSATGKSGADAFLPKRLIRTDLLSTIREVAPALRALWNGMERREGPSRPAQVLGWDGTERRRRLPVVDERDVP